ncbi:MAG: adenosylcobinamide-GDP ribazoletransferase [Methanobrevibacter sp.]|uniref:adenosylcobinamide-GDP ribazoletransferase n=1 Tax=Methanobrevibacter sp. TaxID=66852 RepID=UPI0026DEA67B|nr:adenosylcobinamide-GDP ribazoletransferase [Methanobrevibacter sp.]MDO5848225.1 adenosylcobinamide-GDP ribazoletransferase [Methanobrevibacter sp.]
MEDDYFKDEKFSPFKSILGLVTFSTILPINVFTSIEYMTKMTWFWPIIHFFIGALAAGVAFICQDFLHFNPLLVAVITYAFLMLITGFNHIDGVMDMADGVMVHGDAKKKISVMKDSMVGAGGIMAAILIALITIAGICNVLDYRFINGIIICEMVAKTSLLTTALTSKPIDGIGSYFIRSTNIVNYAVSTIIVAVLCFLLGNIVGIFGLIGAMFAGAVVSLIAKKNFGVANGDVLGTSNEIGRAVALLFMIIMLFY